MGKGRWNENEMNHHHSIHTIEWLFAFNKITPKILYCLTKNKLWHCSKHFWWCFTSYQITNNDSDENFWFEIDGKKWKWQKINHTFGFLSGKMEINKKNLEGTLIVNQGNIKIFYFTKKWYR